MNKEFAVGTSIAALPVGMRVVAEAKTNRNIINYVTAD